MSPIEKVRFIELPTVSDPRGNLTFMEGGCHIPFEIKRVFYITDVPAGASRGDHAHKTCEEVMFVIQGSVDLHISDGITEMELKLDSPGKGILIPAEVWLRTDNFAPGTICLVLCSHHFDMDDYILGFDNYLKLRNIDKNKD